MTNPNHRWQTVRSMNTPDSSDTTNEAGDLREVGQEQATRTPDQIRGVERGIRDNSPANDEEEQVEETADFVNDDVRDTSKTFEEATGDFLGHIGHEREQNRGENVRRLDDK